MKSNNRTLLIVVIVLVVFCCLCSLAAAGGAGIYYYAASQAGKTMDNAIPPIMDGASPIPTEDVSVPTSESSTLSPAEPTETEVPIAPDATGVPQSGNTKTGLGVSRQQMVAFLNSGDAFTFDKPVTTSGFESVTGYHKTLCLKGDCAAVTLLGPADNLLAVSVAVPTDPTDSAQTLTCMALLMDMTSHFSGGDDSFSTRMLQDVLNAQKNQSALKKSATVNGFKYTETYAPKSHIAAVAVSK